MILLFTARGHPNITSKHATTLEFTQDNFVSLRGDCIIGISADFQAKKLKKQIAEHLLGLDGDLQRINKKITLQIVAQNARIKRKEIETISGEFNDSFNNSLNELGDKQDLDEQELVLRISSFESSRTFMIRADKAARHLKPGFRSLIKLEDTEIEVYLV